VLAPAARRADELAFPHGPYMHVYRRFMESWICIETGQLDRAVALVADLLGQTERYGFDIMRLYGGVQQTVVGGVVALGADDPDPAALAAYISTLTTHLDTMREIGANAYVTFFDAVLGQLLIAAGQPELARARLDTGLQLAQDTGMRFYDAELLRLRARTQVDPDAGQADLDAALELARLQGATLFELRAALDDYDRRGAPARVALVDAAGRIPADSPLPELARAQAIRDQAGR
jgi:hypothetical protein